MGDYISPVVQIQNPSPRRIYLSGLALIKPNNLIRSKILSLLHAHGALVNCFLACLRAANSRSYGGSFSLRFFSFLFPSFIFFNFQFFSFFLLPPFVSLLLYYFLLSTFFTFLFLSSTSLFFFINLTWLFPFFPFIFFCIFLFFLPSLPQK